MKPKAKKEKKKKKKKENFANTLRQECVHSRASLHLDCTVNGTKAAFVAKGKEIKHEGLNNTALSLSLLDAM